MTLINAYNGMGLIYAGIPNAPTADFGPSSIGTMNTVGHTVFGVGRIKLSTGPGTSKTISAAGSGKILFLTGAVTWANVATNIRLGIQDIAAGLPDGTFDVFADLVPGTETITANVVNKFTMESGSKTIAHDDVIAVGMNMTARAGADAVAILRGQLNNLDYSIGLAGTKVTSTPLFLIEFDDGTVGFFDPMGIPYVLESSAAFNSGSTPDEYGLSFRLPWPVSLSGVYIRFGSSPAGDFEVIIYDDPFGTPSALVTLAQSTTDLAAVAGNYFKPAGTSYVNLSKDTDYVIALRPTTGSNVAFRRLNFGSGNGIVRLATMLGTHASQVTRTDQTGAFGSADTTLLPLFGLQLGQFDDGTGGGSGGEHSAVF